MIDTNLKQQVRDAQFNNAVKAARQRKFVAGCAQSGRIYSRAQHQPRKPRPARNISERRVFVYCILAAVVALAVASGLARLVLVALKPYLS